jgi:type II secretory pathway component PulM
MIYFALLFVIALLLVILYAVVWANSEERIKTQIRHLEYYTALQTDIRNLTASIVRQNGGTFLLPPTQPIPTEKWFSGKTVVIPKT